MQLTFYYYYSKKANVFVLFLSIYVYDDDDIKYYLYKFILFSMRFIINKLGKGFEQIFESDFVSNAL